MAAAIVDLADQLGSAGVVVETTLDDGLDAVPPDLRTTVYRVVQESLANVRKHAGTDRATVAIRRAAAAIHLEVRDAGVGFDLDEARRRGFGLVGMTERVRLAGGTIDVETRPAAGCRVTARLPIPDAEDEPSVPGRDASADLGSRRPNAAAAPARPSVARP
jgi:signal transduction histidine kinase